MKHVYIYSERRRKCLIIQGTEIKEKGRKRLKIMGTDSTFEGVKGPPKGTGGLDFKHW